MKSLILFFLFLSSLYSADTFYLGADYGYNSEEFSDNISAKSSGSSATLKVGYGDIKAYAIEFSYTNIDNDAKIFSNKDGSKNEFNIDLVKAYDLDIYVYPFIKAGFGTGYFKIDRTLQDTLHYGNFNLGAGIFIPINNIVDAEIGYKYKYISYEAIDTINEKTSYNSHANAGYIGLNIRF